MHGPVPPYRYFPWQPARYGDRSDHAENPERPEHCRRKVAAQGEWLKAQLAELQKRYPVIGHVRGLGMMIGIEIVKPNEPADHMVASW
jgi:hypothetical protein